MYFLHLYFLTCTSKFKTVKLTWPPQNKSLRHMNHLNLRKHILCLLVLFVISGKINAQKTTLEVNTSKTITKIQPTMYGVFFEDINFAADGGLYAEMIKNRSFEFEAPLMGWIQPNSD